MTLIRRLLELQEAHGWLSEEMVRDLSRRENVPLYRLQGLVSFYPHFRTSPPPAMEWAVCRDMTCWLNGAPDACRRLREQMASRADVEVKEVSCLGRCELAPACTTNGTPGTLGDVNNKAISRHEERRLWRSDPYAAPAERYAVLREFLRRERSEAVSQILAVLKESGLRGMGGAGFPTTAKLEMVLKENRTPKYVICNADESEPGTFKDRVILADLAHLVIEGMMLAGLVVGAERGILFIRHEYERERHLFARALEEARKAGFDFDIEIFVSPGGYILGEETALLECLEDRRGEPRNKPPFPGTHGLRGQPTLINNVETFALVPGILRHGPDWWKAQGKPGFSGLKFIALSGHVERPGVYEVSVGTTVRELIALGGGVKNGRPLLAFAPGGASSNFLPASMVDVPLDFAALAKAGSMLGSGAVVVVAEGTDMLALAANVVRFFRNESCGKCVPCRIGSQRAVELLERALAGQADRKELQVLEELGETLALTSICGLGQVALNPILSVMKHWPHSAGGLARRAVTGKPGG
jgi:NADH:ubiquinone oxidoreductase subunit F (NADH-binding)/NADH:ubiquinone oxidoreductase subunit E